MLVNKAPLSSDIELHETVQTTIREKGYANLKHMHDAGQMSEASWENYQKDPAFAAWLAVQK
ncbi:hypothetical protein [Sphingomonas sp.]|uniref:hypothetical protein n=1 Tax=Sphingomonas sp. TaxID=28214 RepID=UPI003D6CAF83